MLLAVTVGEARLLGPVEIRGLAEELDLRPTKTLGQNFVHDANTVRRIVRAADLAPDEQVLEVGPGSVRSRLALLPEVAGVTAVEIDPGWPRGCPPRWPSTPAPPSCSAPTRSTRRSPRTR